VMVVKNNSIMKATGIVKMDAIIEGQVPLN
jgi:hypothetical protein